MTKLQKYSIGSALSMVVAWCSNLTEQSLYSSISHSGRKRRLQSRSAKHYALFPKRTKLPVGILPLPKGILLKRYYTTTNFAYVELDAAGEGSATFQINEKNYRKHLNDQEIPLPIIVNPLSSTGRLLISSGRDTARIPSATFHR